ncbi:hypothetical protein Dimus_019026 [Dionaea muscipula]
MASASLEKICHFCRKWPTNLRDGWRLTDGGFASLCNNCATAFENNRFCLSFHKQQSGWRDCIECGKSIHCGCVVERHTYVTNDFHGITCVACLVEHFPEGLNNLSTPSKSPDQSVPNSKDCPDSQESGMSEKISMDKCYHGSPLSSEIRRQEVTGLAANILISERVSREVAKFQIPALIPLFEIVLSPEETDARIGRLVLPETFVQAYFPEVPERRGTPMRIWDSEGRLWKLMLRSMMVKKKRLIVLDGTRNCIIKMQWKAGDLLRFYRKDPEGEMFIGLKKIAGAGGPTKQYQNGCSSQAS